MSDTNIPSSLDNSDSVQHQQIRAIFDDKTITIYQAYNNEIADSALLAQTFIPPLFDLERMTWIKPSFLWMAYRSGWATKTNQERILAIKIKRSGFEWALKNSTLTHGKNINKVMPVRIQWDPERSIKLGKLPYRSIQIGLSKEAVEKYVNEWIVEIKDVTFLMKEIEECVKNKNFIEALAKLPKEEVYQFLEEPPSNLWSKE
uniref:DUF4291 domain-containing protein n=1 Tax=Panagrolaimus sp. PS1159 TaxID=55785 RepID=A0AC35F9X8_9BILA